VGLVARAHPALAGLVPRLPVVPVAPAQVLVVPVVLVAALPVARVVPVAVSPVVPAVLAVVPVGQPPVAAPVVRRAVRAVARTRSVAPPSVVARADVVVETNSLHQ
jgi:hypothetical protein